MFVYFIGKMLKQAFHGRGRAGRKCAVGLGQVLAHFP